MIPRTSLWLRPGSALLAGALLAITAGAQSSVKLNEVLANNVTSTNLDGGVTDWVELFNTSASQVDLSDASLTDSTSNPRRFVFPTGATLPGHGYLVIRFASPATGLPLNAGFGLKDSGGGVYFHDSRVNGGGLIDSIEFGVQAADLSLGRAMDGAGNWALNLPTPGTTNVVARLGSVFSLRINEWMAERGDASDWFELYNSGNLPVALGGLYLTDNPGATPDKSRVLNLSFIGTGSRGAYALFFADGGLGGNHVNFKLDAEGGESIGLFNANLTRIDAINFGAQQSNVSQGRLPDGSASFTSFPESPSPGAPNRFLAPLTDVVINELLTHTDPPLEDAIEFHNTTDRAINLGGWILMASSPTEDPKEYRIPGDLIMPPHGYAVLYEYQFAGSAHLTFNSAHGGEVALFQTDSFGSPMAVTRQSYDAAANGVSFGRFPRDDEVDFVAMSARSFGYDKARSNAQFRQGRGAANPGPLVGPLVINEIMYRPPDIMTNDNTLDEFIEIRNLSNARLPLFDQRYRTNRWRLRDAVSFDFPSNSWVEPTGIVLVVSFSPLADLFQLAAFRSKYGVAASVPIFGPYDGELSNSGESVELVRPDAVQLSNHDDAGYVPYLLVDRVKYKDGTRWPPEADGTGLSLQRRNRFVYGDDPANWKADHPTTGRPNATPPAITLQPLTQIYVAGTDVTFRTAATGTPPLSCQWRLNGTNLSGATNPELPLIHLDPSDLGAYSVVVSNDEGSITSATAWLRMDSKSPALRIIAPRPNERTGNDVLTVHGSVRDDLGVLRVLVSLNGGALQPADGTTNWSIQLPLVAGTNIIQAHALDRGHNESAPLTLSVFRVVASPLTLLPAGMGSGTVTPDLDGQRLEVGRGYSVAATPGSGSLFSHWMGSGAGESIHSSQALLDFLMQSNLVLEAVFVPNPFLPIRGTYNGLFFETGAVRHESSGFFTATTTDLGAYTASLQMGTKRFPFRGQFDLSGRATNRVVLGGTNVLTVELQLDIAAGTDQIRGRVVNGAWVAELTADRSTFHAVENRTALAGRHTLIIAGNSNFAASPVGDGYGTLTIDPSGWVSLAGALGDGSKISQKVPLSKNGDWPFYVGLSGNRGSILGWLMVTNRAEDDLHGLLSWFKPPLSGRHYPNGFGTDVMVQGSRYRPPADERVLNLTNAFVTFTGGNLIEAFTTQVQVGADNKLEDLSHNELTLSVSLPNGLMSGRVNDPATGKTLSFKGALLQRQNQGSGYFLGTNESGRVHLGP